MNLTDLERELDAACGGKSLDETQKTGMSILEKMRRDYPMPESLRVDIEKHQLLKDCHKLLASYVGATYRPNKLAEWGIKRVELMERIESVVKP